MSTPALGCDRVHVAVPDPVGRQRKRRNEAADACKRTRPYYLCVKASATSILVIHISPSVYGYTAVLPAQK